MPACSMVIFPGRVAIHLRCASVPAIITAKYSVHNKYSVFTSHGSQWHIFCLQVLSFQRHIPRVDATTTRRATYYNRKCVGHRLSRDHALCACLSRTDLPYCKRYHVRIVFEEIEKLLKLEYLSSFFL